MHEELLTKLESVKPCDWVRGGFLHSMYYYVKRTGALPSLCHNCWKIFAFFPGNECFTAFVEKMEKEERMSPDRTSIFSQGRSHKAEVVERAGGRILLVIDADGREDCDELGAQMEEISKDGEMDYKVEWRRAGQYWEDMFPELFGQRRDAYEPHTRGYSEFRERAEKLSEDDLAERVSEEIDWMERAGEGSP